MQTVDFSSAQRQGFIVGFVDAFTARPDNHYTRDYLAQKAESLLRGCSVHFMRGIIRLSNISAVVHPMDKYEFRNRGRQLLKVTDIATFVEQVEKILKSWTMTKPFFDWWTMREHAQMLFPAFFAEKPEWFWQLVPTSNGAESMHNRIYIACGIPAKTKPRLDIIPGCTSLILFLNSTRTRAIAKSSEPSV